ncbi:MAG: hypothetical protein WCK39_06825 [Methanomassiliicoccales archaeon]
MNPWDVQRARVCQNHMSGTLAIGIPKCGNDREVRTTIKYNAVESDTLELCRMCMSKVRKDAHQHGYAVHSEALK